jgi:two-component system cell cycle response regulator
VVALGDDEETAVVNLAHLYAARSQVRDRHLLVRVQGGQVGQVFSLGGQPWRVGRARDSDLVLADGGVSRQQAQITWSGDTFRLEDLGSANGTYVNGERITEHQLSDGDLIQFGPSAVFRYEMADADQQALLEQLYDASVTDSLTGAFNREYFDSRLESELSYARRHGTELCLLMLDIDHFKRVNDSFGHPAGDLVLVELASCVSSNMRAEDVFARYGGEEFTIILRNVTLQAAERAGERFRLLIESLRIPIDGKTVPVTVSIGAASLACCEAPDAMALITVADRRLYAAKRGGRNRVVATG